MNSDKERILKFNIQLKEFLTQLDNIKKLEKIDNRIEVLLKSEDDNNSEFIIEFYDKCKNNQDIIFQKDNFLFKNENFIWGIDFNLYLTDDKMINFVWKYIYTLYIYSFGFKENKDLQSIIKESEKDKNKEYTSFVSILNKFKDEFSSMSKKMEDMVESEQSLLGEGMIFNLAKELADEINPEDLNIDNPAELLQNLLSGGGNGENNQLMDIVKNITSKIDSKLSSGNIDEQKLFSEASNMMSQLGGNDMMKNMFQHMNSQTEESSDTNGMPDIANTMPDIASLMKSMNPSENPELGNIMNQISENMGIPPNERPSLSQLSEIASSFTDSQSDTNQLGELQARRERLRLKLEEKKKMLDPD